jgi:hypothetical protein
MHNAVLTDWIKARSQGAELVLSVCTGALLLAKAGLLDGLEATTHHGAIDLLREVATKGLPKSRPSIRREPADNNHLRRPNRLQQQRGDETHDHFFLKPAASSHGNHRIRFFMSLPPKLFAPESIRRPRRSAASRSRMSILFAWPMTGAYSAKSIGME